MRGFAIVVVAVAALVVLLGAWTNGWQGSLERQAELAPLQEAERAANIAQGAESLAGETDAAPGTAPGPGMVAPEPPPPVDTVVEEPEVFVFEGGELEAEVQGPFVDADAGAVAVVVAVANPDPVRPIVDATIQIELLDAAGEVVGTNTDPGTDERLNRIPSIPAGGETLFVNDTIVPTGEPVSARARATGTPADVTLQELDVRGAALAGSAFGVTATGTVGNPGGAVVEQARAFAVVRDAAGAIVGAGSALLEPIEPGGEQPFTIFVVGETAGELEVVVPALASAGATGPADTGPAPAPETGGLP
ncbi:MAG: FxLYD domain-containing protein [Thermoleophilia bacterium]